MPSALPPDAAERCHLDSNATTAYQTCIAFEQHVTTTTTAGELELVYARILGYLIIYAPSLPARHEVVKVIQSCERDFEALSELGECFFDYFIRPFKAFKGRTPLGSSHSSRDSLYKNSEELLLAKIREPPKHFVDAKHQALARDGYRCPVTGLYDARAKSMPHITMEDLLSAGGAVYTGCAHIAPDLTYLLNRAVKSHEDSEKDYSAAVLAVLRQFGYDIDNLNGEKVHSLCNVITMEANVHDYFDRLGLWFEPTATPNSYKIRTADPLSLYIYLSGIDQITFTTPDPIKLPLPSPSLLALHAACAQVASLSGANEYIDRIHEEMEEMGVLKDDGTSFDVLRHALMTRLGIQKYD
ncbi:hypothetical protein JAAARDRAFT_212033 [Jaapia argillacea MUCL 33604]|uniref:HNH nuclease domain-containing protein n=1 Tax=Jaapia argillacea MUCL 33604 TaxID=933084 RepID=A0A067P4M2_9AGAM|nr:hypothetical protein JAAARDRAFT_212033 [Jaapia argillacea MUCL 33604]